MLTIPANVDEEDQQSQQQMNEFLQEIDSIASENQKKIISDDIVTPVESAETNIENASKEEISQSSPAVVIEDKKKEEVCTKTQLHVGNIPNSWGEKEFNEYFGQFGEISTMTLAASRQKANGHRGFAFLYYVDPKVAKTVVEMKSHKFKGRELKVEFAKGKTVKLFIRGIDKNITTKATLSNFFSNFGKVTDTYCVNSRGFAFVTMEENGENIKKIIEKEKYEIDGASCSIMLAKKKQLNSRSNRGRGRGRGRGRSNYGNSWGNSSGSWSSQAAWNPQQQHWQPQQFQGYQQQQAWNPQQFQGHYQKPQQSAGNWGNIQSKQNQNYFGAAAGQQQQKRYSPY